MFSSSLISADQNWAIWAILFAVATFGLWAEKTKWGAYLSGAIVSILGSFVLSNLSIIPLSAPAYDLVWSYLVPLAIPLLLFKANLRKIIKEAGPTFIAFGFGAIGTVIGTIIAFEIVPLGPEGWKLAGIFASTYIGGSMNYVAAAQVLQLNSSNLLAAGVAADDLIMTLYFLVLFTIPSIKFFQKFYSTKHQDNIKNIDEETSTNIKDDKGITILNLGKALTIGAAFSAIGFGLEYLTGVKGIGILIITILVVIAATLFPKQVGGIKGADIIGVFLMQIFFAAIGASANIMIIINYGAILFLFAALILLVHLIFILTAGKLFKLDLAEIVIASNANMGGPTTAAAMAVARKWENLVIPAILCGTLGYAIATFIGAGVGYWLK